jgi:hypothetical protein
LVKEAYSNRKVSSGKILGSVTDEAYLLVLELGWADRIYQMCVHVLSGPLLGKVLSICALFHIKAAISSDLISHLNGTYITRKSGI